MKTPLATRVSVRSRPGPTSCRALALWLALLLACPLPVASQQTQGGADQREGGARVIRDLLSFPSIAIIEPRNGSILTREDVSVVVTFRDQRDDLDLTSFRVFINAVDRTRDFQISAGTATGRFDLRRPAASQSQGQVVPVPGQDAAIPPPEQQPALLDGQNTVVASIKNRSGNMATTSAAFILDTTTVLRGRAVPRSLLEQAFLDPPARHPSETARPGMPGGRSLSRDLSQFGYDAFRALLPGLAPAANLPVDPNYTLGAGDSLVLYVWNIPGTAQLFESAPLVVDRAGAVFVPRVGAVPLGGLTVSQAQDVLRARLSRNFSGFELRLTLGELRAISVYVMGEVARPGAYSISAFSTVLDALFVAGGPTKMGSLRSVRVTRTSGAVEELDLYDFLLRGTRPTGNALESGDTVFVPPIGPVAGITGEVKRPAIYELRPGTTVGALIAMAGGPLPTAGLSRIQVERLQGSKGRTVLDLPFIAEQGGGGQEVVQDGDLVLLFPAPARLENAVTLEGFVHTPGLYEIKPGMRVSDLLTPDMLLPEAYRERVEIARIRPDFSREILSVNLNRLWAPTPDATQDLVLEPLDRISVQSEVIGLATVTVTGEVKRPGTYVITKGERLSSLLRRAGGFTPEAFPRGAVFTRESIRQREQQQLEKFVRAQSQTIMAESAATAAGAAEVSGQAAYVGAQAAITRQQTDLLRSLASAVTFGRLAIRLDEPAGLEGTTDDILLENADSLHVPQLPTSVLIIGAVRNSTSILWRNKQNAEYYIGRAGGATREADVTQTYILKADGSAVASFVKLRDIEPGDAIVVPISTEPRIRTLPLIKDLATIVSGFALPFATIYSLLRD
jgi:protein involved in polysaccharide export with SLBB domain